MYDVLSLKSRTRNNPSLQGCFNGSTVDASPDLGGQNIVKIFEMAICSLYLFIYVLATI